MFYFSVEAEAPRPSETGSCLWRLLVSPSCLLIPHPLLLSRGLHGFCCHRQRAGSRTGNVSGSVTMLWWVFKVLPSLSLRAHVEEKVKGDRTVCEISDW